MQPTDPAFAPPFTETYRMPGWILALLAVSYFTVTALLWGLEGKGMLQTLAGAHRPDGAVALSVWGGISVLELGMIQFLIRAPFTWRIDDRGIHYRFGVWRRRSIPWSELQALKSVHLEPWDAGGYGVKWGPHGWTYAFFEGPAIQLIFLNQRRKSVCFAFKNAALGAAALSYAQSFLIPTDGCSAPTPKDSLHPA